MSTVITFRGEALNSVQVQNYLYPYPIINLQNGELQTV